MKKKPVDKRDSVIPPTTKGRTEKDIDDLVHSQQEEKPTELGDQDPDDLVHQPNKRNLASNQNLEDPDDLVHDYDEEDE